MFPKDRGESWKKVNKYVTSGNYYQEVFCDPLDSEKVFLWIHGCIIQQMVVKP